MLGASKEAHTSRDSPSVTALPPDEGVELADVDSAQDERSLSRHRQSVHDGTPSEDGRSSPLIGSAGTPAMPFATSAIRILVFCIRFPRKNRMRDPSG